jgi:hypothetical protein
MLANFGKVLAASPSIVVILGGTNDLLTIAAPSVDNISTMAQEASAAGAKVIIGMIPRAAFPSQTAYDAAIATWNAAKWAVLKPALL